MLTFLLWVFAVLQVISVATYAKLASDPAARVRYHNDVSKRQAGTYVYLMLCSISFFALTIWAITRV